MATWMTASSTRVSVVACSIQIGTSESSTTTVARVLQTTRAREVTLSRTASVAQPTRPITSVTIAISGSTKVCGSALPPGSVIVSRCRRRCRPRKSRS
jgi:hypothetical protein